MLFNRRKRNYRKSQDKRKKKKNIQLELKEQLEKTKQKIEKLAKDVETLEDFDQERTVHQENKRVKVEKEKQKEAFEYRAARNRKRASK